MLRLTSQFSSKRNTFYEGDPAPAPNNPNPAPNNPNPAPNNPNPAPNNPNPNPQTFTQIQVNEILAKEKRGWQQKQTELLTQLEQLQQNNNLTQQERDGLQQQIDQIRANTQTEVERYKGDLDKLNKKYKGDTENLSKERDSWKNRFESSMKNRDLTDAAVEHKAFNPAQIRAILLPNTVVEEALGEDQKPTGELITMVNFEGKDKDGKAIKLKLKPSEAIKLMTEMPDSYGNLFQNEGNSGLNTNNIPRINNKLDLTGDIDLETYKKSRQQIMANRG